MNECPSAEAPPASLAEHPYRKRGHKLRYPRRMAAADLKILVPAARFFLR